MFTKSTLLWVGMIFFAAGFIGMGGLYLLEKSEVPAFENQMTEDDASNQPRSAAFAMEAAEVTTTAADISSYEAKVGKFKLSLDGAYAIVVHNDGSLNGTASTQLEVGRKRDEQSGVVDAALNGYVKIEAYPSKSHGSRDQFVTSDTVLQAASAVEEKELIDRVPARKFTVATLGKTQKYYFEQNGVTYMIEAWDISNSETLDTLNNVINGFSFK